MTAAGKSNSTPQLCGQPLGNPRNEATTPTT
jgi:hypothetical protein